MITCNLMGGLGNQLFQIATTLTVAWENNDRAIFDLKANDNPLQGNPAHYYKKTLYRNLTDRKPWFVKHTFKEKNHHYSPIIYHPRMKLWGYFQSEKYFIKYRDSLIKLFTSNTEVMNQIQEIYQENFSDYQCAIHIRRGDYLKYPNHHPICSLDYYAKAIQYFDNSTNFVIFSDDIDWCRHQDLFQEKRFDFWTSQRDDLDLYLMSIFPHQVIANSSFSWWASWLNIYQNKKVIAPSLWFGENLKHLNTEDIYASYMLKI